MGILREADLPTGIEPGVPTAATPDPSYRERRMAGFDAATVETDMANYSGRLAERYMSELQAIMPVEVTDAFEADPRFDGSTAQRAQAFMDIAATQVTDGPGQHFPKSLDDFNAEIDRRRRQTWEEAQAVLDVNGGGAAAMVGTMERYILDPINIALLPFGAGAGASLRTIMLTEAILNAGAEAATLPREFRVSRELGTPEPEPISRIAGGFVAGGAFAGVLGGAVRGAKYLTIDRAVSRERARLAGGDPNLAEGDIAAAGARLAGDDTQMPRARRNEISGQGEAAKPDFAPGATHRTRIEFSNPSAAPGPEIMTVIGTAVEDVLGPDARVVVTSGVRLGSHDPSGRHRTGRTADVAIYRADGSQITAGDPEMAEIARSAARNGAQGIGFGTEYMGGAHMHIDLVGTEAGGGHYWASGATAIGGELVELMQTGAVPQGRALTMADFDFSRTGNASAQGNRVGYVYGKLLTLGYDPKTASALVGNAMQESGPGLNTGAIGDSGAAFGMGQWNGPRKRALERFAAERGADPRDIDTQIDFWHFELQGPENAALQRIIAAPDVASAARVASEAFWRPGIPHIENRIAYASSIFEQFNSGRIPRWTGAASSPQAFAGYSGGTSRGYTRTGQVLVGDDTRLDVEYQVVDLASLRQASGDLQPRDRTRAASDDWVAATAARLDPALLMPSPTADRGAPLIGPDDIIESGNGRVRALERAYDQGLDRADAYRAQIEAAGYAIPEGVERPVLIARRATELDDAARVKMVVDAQDSGVARLTAPERAEIGNRALSADVMALHDPTKKLTDPANRDFARAFTNFYPKSERGAFTAADKGLSVDGIRQIQDALFARAWAAPDIVARAVEAEPGGLKSLLDALAAAAPDVAALRAEIAAGIVRPEMDITPHVLEAVRLIMTARDLAEAGQGAAAKILDELIADTDLLDGAWSPLTRALVEKFMPNGRAASAKDIAEFLSRYAQEARKAGRAGDAFGGAGPLDVLKAIDKQTFGKLDETGSPRELLADRAPEPEPEIATPPPGLFDEGSASPAVEAANDAAEADLRASVRPVEADPASGRITRLSEMADGDAVALERRLQAEQRHTSIDEMLARGAPNHAELDAEIDAAAKSAGARQKKAELKSRDRIEEKLEAKYAGNLNRLTDVARGGVEVNSPEQADAFVAALSRRYQLLDEGWHITSSGYFDRKLAVIFDDGMIGEVQIWEPGLLAAKSDGGHDLYKVSRDLAQPATVRAQAEAEMRALYGAVRAELGEQWRDVLGDQAANGTPPMAATSAVNRSSLTSGDLSSARISSDEIGDQVPSSASDNITPGESSTAGYSRSTRKYRMGQSPSTSDMGRGAGDVNIETDPGAGRLTASETQEAALRRDLAARPEDLDELEVTFDDGTTFSAREALDMIEEDRDLTDLIDICVKGSA